MNHKQGSTGKPRAEKSKKKVCVAESVGTCMCVCIHVCVCVLWGAGGEENDSQYALAGNATPH